VLRIEDTDRERSTEASVDAILEGLGWLGLDWDEGPFYQTQRFVRYREVTERLIAEGKAYRCYCPRERLEALRADQMRRKVKPRYDGRCRSRTELPRPGESWVVRFRNPDEGEVVFDDAVRGNVRISNEELDDLIIARTDGTPTYNFTVVVDDLDMRITHVIRGDDHVNNTPRQINILKALGAELPVYAHVPMILGPDGGRLSKRHGAVSVTQFRDEGYLPDALVNHLVRLGWSYGNQEIFSREEMVRLFDISDVHRAAATFDFEKLNWLNQQYIKALPAEAAAEPFERALAALRVSAEPPPRVEDVFDAQRERAKTFAEMAASSRYFWEDFDDYAEGSARKHLRPVVLKPLRAVRERLAALERWDPQAIHDAISGAAEEAGLKLGRLGQPVRVAVCGRAVSPPFDVTLALVGRERTLSRIDRAIAFVAERASG